MDNPNEVLAFCSKAGCLHPATQHLKFFQNWIRLCDKHTEEYVEIMRNAKRREA